MFCTKSDLLMIVLPKTAIITLSVNNKFNKFLLVLALITNLLIRQSVLSTRLNAKNKQRHLKIKLEV